MEDRKVALDFDWRAGKGTLLCIFDGLSLVAIEHLAQRLFSGQDWRSSPTWRPLSSFLPGHVGPHLVEHTAQALPPLIITALQALPPTASKSTVSSILKSTIEDYDASLLQAVYDIFPLPELEHLTEVEIEARMEEDGNEKKALLATRGTTALICLLDPDRKGLWVANVGDCQACAFQLIRRLYPDFTRSIYFRMLTRLLLLFLKCSQLGIQSTTLGRQPCRPPDTFRARTPARTRPRSLFSRPTIQTRLTQSSRMDACWV